MKNSFSEPTVAAAPGGAGAEVVAAAPGGAGAEVVAAAPGGAGAEVVAAAPGVAGAEVVAAAPAGEEVADVGRSVAAPAGEEGDVVGSSVASILILRQHSTLDPAQPGHGLNGLPVHSVHLAPGRKPRCPFGPGQKRPIGPRSPEAYSPGCPNRPRASGPALYQA
eukprot:gene23325-biopygen17805